MKRLRFLALLLVIPFIVTSCHTPVVDLQLINDTGACGGGPCNLLVIGANQTSGSGTNAGPDNFIQVVPPGPNGTHVKISSGVWSLQTVSTCHNNTFTFNFAAGSNWFFRFFCGGAAPNGATESLGQGATK